MNLDMNNYKDFPVLLTNPPKSITVTLRKSVNKFWTLQTLKWLDTYCVVNGINDIELIDEEGVLNG